ncbi:hypothetical protein F5148DRAFT_459777 [Russula earlei]|uniref:Uncharacterized protein n=1 Tax=Russula earlei TaxID=71964 RepID=A0ACC0TYE5_9AGAM|nr:hypothetical protein F5148DRAFT_459777 [Russula earlei]
MRIYVFAVFCLAIGIAPSFGLPAGDGNSSQNSQGGLIPKSHDRRPSYDESDSPLARAKKHDEERKTQQAHEWLMLERQKGRFTMYPWADGYGKDSGPKAKYYEG